MKVVHVFSGGLDSTCLLAEMVKAKFEIECLGFNYGSKHNEKEISAAKDIAEYFDVRYRLVRMPFINYLFKSDLLLTGGDIPEGYYRDENMSRTVIPLRNGIMAMIAAGYADSIEYNYVSLGIHSGDHVIYPDCRPEFAQFLGMTILAGTKNQVDLYTPYLHLDKSVILGRGYAAGVPDFLTWTCYKGEDLHCGVCGACVERQEAYNKLGYSDPVKYKEV